LFNKTRKLFLPTAFFLKINAQLPVIALNDRQLPLNNVICPFFGKPSKVISVTF
jgi:hypothetical protein